MKKIWKSWKNIVKKIISFEATIIFGVIFFVIIFPLSVILKLINPSILRGNNYKKKKNSYWNNLPKREFDIEFARKQ